MRPIGNTIVQLYSISPELALRKIHIDCIFHP